MRVVGFEDEADFLVSKQLEGLDIKSSIRQIKQEPRSISFQGNKIKRNPLDGLRNVGTVADLQNMASSPIFHVKSLPEESKGETKPKPQMSKFAK